MSVARITEISAASEKSLEDRIAQGIVRATETLRNFKSGWVTPQGRGARVSATRRFNPVAVH